MFGRNKKTTKDWRSVPKTRTFGGQVYKLVGREENIFGTKRDQTKWAKFQREYNDKKVRVVKVSGGYVSYIKD